MIGHKNPITGLDYSRDNQELITVENGAEPLSIVWKYNKRTHQFNKLKFKVNIDEVRLVCLSPDAKYCCFIGETKKSKDCISIYDLEGKKPKNISKHLSEFNILDFKFSPIESLKFVSCGKENIKFWRIKNKHLTGCPVILNNYARKSIFTVLDFDMHSYSSELINNNKVIVGSS